MWLNNTYIALQLFYLTCDTDVTKICQVMWPFFWKIEKAVLKGISGYSEGILRGKKAIEVVKEEVEWYRKENWYMLKTSFLYFSK